MSEDPTERLDSGSSNRGRILIIGSIIVSLILCGGYLAAGGASYKPASVQNPCDPRPWRDPQGVEEIAQQFSLSALDGAACRLGVSREELAQALTTGEARRQFAEDHGIDDAELEEAVQAGLVRAIDDAQDAGAISALAAIPLREVAKRLPVEDAINLIGDSSRLFDNVSGYIDGAGGLLAGAQDALGQANDLLPDEIRKQLPPEVQDLLKP